ncbi:MAG: nucleoside-diphosphate sugar epimerase/dehydratase [Desulfomonilia bacterium]|nr:nucleoside-diphosphate sugar epimerase/dehydratase [Desulfomonilia bacterium]
MNLFKRKNFWIILCIDLVLLSLCYYGAHWLRFDGRISSAVIHNIKITIIPLLVLKISCFYLFHLYRGMWRYAGINDLFNVFKGCVAGSILFFMYVGMIYKFIGFSRGALLNDFILSILAIGGIRLMIRLSFQMTPAYFQDLVSRRSNTRNLIPSVIVGTGPIAERLLREIQASEVLTYRVIGFLDSTRKTKGMTIHGVPILGPLRKLPEITRSYQIKVVLITKPEEGSLNVSALVSACAGLGVQFKVVPSISERIQGSIAENLRDIRVEDLLERKPVQLDMDLVKNELDGQTVLVTGAGGSIGSELARQIFMCNPRTLILLDNAETPLYHIDMELRLQGEGDTEIIPCIGDVRSFKGLDRVFKKYQPDFVYHAAAYKHVPMMEANPLDAVNNNVIGTFKLASAATKHHVKKFVLISTDKAVRPTSVMGATKRVAEMVVQSMNGNGTKFVIVRFGNVLGSNGSVVPLFEQQIASGGPVTVTDPEVTRYFMTIPEAVMLVLQAGALGAGGELFLLDMGEPVKIVDLAKNMIRLAGLIPDRDIKIEFIGLRPGEKLKEELLIMGEGIVDTAHEKIKICSNSPGVDEATLFENIRLFNLLVKDTGNPHAAVEILKRLIPAFHFNRMNFEERALLLEKKSSFIKSTEADLPIQ